MNLFKPAKGEFLSKPLWKILAFDPVRFAFDEETSEMRFYPFSSIYFSDLAIELAVKALKGKMQGYGLACFMKVAWTIITINL